MSVAYGSSAAVAHGTAANTTYAVSGIAQNNCILIAHVEYASSGSAPTPTPPAGFTAIPGTWPKTATTGSDQFALWVWQKVAGASETGSYVVTHASATRWGAIYYTTGNDPATPVAAVTQNSGNSVTTTWTGVTGAAGEHVVLFGADGWDTSNTLTAPTGSTPTYTAHAQSPGIFTGGGTLASAGATGNPTQTNNSASWDVFMAALVVVQPPITIAAQPSVATRNTAAMRAANY